MPAGDSSRSTVFIKKVKDDNPCLAYTNKLIKLSASIIAIPTSKK